LERICEKEVFEEPEARKISRRLLDAVYYCHRKHIVHRDIKPENILLNSKDNDTSIKLGDFGCARRFEPGTAQLVTLCGSPQYVAPELYTHNDGYDERCDIWSCGIVIYVILGGYAPFDADDHELPKIICEGHFEFHPKYWDDVSQRAKSLISSLLKVDPQERATIEEALNSEWLRRRDKDTIRKSNMDGSLTSFEAWCHSQHSGFSGSSSGKSMNMEHLTEEEDSSSSLQPDELL
jgi:serine/threonine protein kinase